MFFLIIWNIELQKKPKEKIFTTQGTVMSGEIPSFTVCLLCYYK